MPRPATTVSGPGRRAVLSAALSTAGAAFVASCSSNGSGGTGQITQTSPTVGPDPGATAPSAGSAGSTSPGAAAAGPATTGSTPLGSSPAPAGTAPATASAASTLRLGFFPNLTHAVALVGLRQGYFARALGSSVTIRQLSFSAGPAELGALLAGSVDIAFIGPSPTITGFRQSGGTALRVIAGACSGGAALVVAREVRTVADLRGRKVGSPQLGNTQDVALRYYLRGHGLRTTAAGGGDVAVVPAANALLLQSFRQGAIAGAWVPEPYLSELVAAGGHVLVDEASLWPGGRFVTTNVVVSAAFLAASPTVVAAFLRGEVDTVAWMAANPGAAKAAANAALGALSGGRALPTAVLDQAWPRLTFTVDPLARTLAADAAHAASVLPATAVDLAGLYHLGPLDAVLAGLHRPTVRGL